MKQVAFIASLFGVAISAEQEREISGTQHSSQIFATQPEVGPLASRNTRLS